MSQVRQRRGAAEKRCMSPTPDYMPFFVDPEPVPKKKNSLKTSSFIPCISTSLHCNARLFSCRSIPPHESVCFIGLSHDRTKLGRKFSFNRLFSLDAREGATNRSAGGRLPGACLLQYSSARLMTRRNDSYRIECFIGLRVSIFHTDDGSTVPTDARVTG